MGKKCTSLTASRPWCNAKTKPNVRELFEMRWLFVRQP